MAYLIVVSPKIVFSVGFDNFCTLLLYKKFVKLMLLLSKTAVHFKVHSVQCTMFRRVDNNNSKK